MKKLIYLLLFLPSLLFGQAQPWTLTPATKLTVFKGITTKPTHFLITARDSNSVSDKGKIRLYVDEIGLPSISQSRNDGNISGLLPWLGSDGLLKFSPKDSLNILSSSYQLRSEKDQANGYVGLDASYQIKIPSFVSGTYTSLIQSGASAARTYSLADRDYLIEGTDQVRGFPLAAPLVGNNAQSIRWNNGSQIWEYYTPSGGGGSGTVTSVNSANGNATVANTTTTPVITIVSAPKLETARTINGTSFDGTGNITVTAVPSGSAGGDLTGTYPNPTLTTSGVSAATYGSATQAPQITFDAKGRATSASNATITPDIGSVTGLGTGVATALGVNTGSAGAFVVNGGALGTPSSGVATNLTGTASGLTAGNVTTNANSTGDVTSVGNVTTYNNVFPSTKGGAGSINGVLKANGSGVVSAATGADIGTVLGYTPADAANVKKFLGTIYDLTPNASSGSLYTSTAPTSTFTFGSGGISLSGADQTNPTNYLEYSSYYTNVGYWTRKIRISPTVDGNGVGIGIHSPNGDHYVRFACSGANKGKLVIATYRSGTVTTRVTSTALSYTNSSDMIEVTITSDMMGYTAVAGVINPTTGDFITVTPIGIPWTDPLTDASISSKWAVGRSAIFHFGGSQTITRDFYSIEESIQKAVTVFGDSKAAGAYAGSAEAMFVNQLNSSVQGGCAFVAGGGNTAAGLSQIQPEILSLKSPVLVLAVSINDIIAGTSTATIVGYLETTAKVAVKQGVLVFIEIPSYVTSSHASAGTINPAVDALATSLNALTYIKTIDVRTALANGTSLNTLYAATDNLHINALGNKQVYIAYLNALSPYVNMSKIPFIQSSTGLAFRQDQPSSVTMNLTNASTNASGGIGIRTIADVAGGFYNTYPSTATGGYANKTILTNSHDGVVIGGFGSGATIQMLSGGSSLTSNVMYTFSPNTIVGAGTTNGAYGIGLTNSNTGSSAQSKITLSSVNTSVQVGAVSSTLSSGYLANNDGFFTVNSTATCKAIFGNQGANGTVAFIAGGSAAGNIFGNITATGLWKIGDATAATAYLHIKAGTATASTAPFKLTAGVPLTTFESGVLETDATNDILYSNSTGKGRVSLLNYVAKTTTYTATNADYTIDCTSGTFTVTLPTAVPQTGSLPGRTFIIKNSGAGTITVATTSSQTIDGASTKTLNVQYGGVEVQSTGTNWIVIRSF